MKTLKLSETKLIDGGYGYYPGASENLAHAGCGAWGTFLGFIVGDYGRHFKGGCGSPYFG